ncbi:MAG: MltA domain-containing protein [Gammaproteobacteria bacterium]|nr:MltA domain-containing protein [Gammaproteobacteria bacterium]
MRQSLFYLLVLSFSISVAAKPIYSLDKQELRGSMVDHSSTELCDVARGTLSYLNRGSSYDPDVIRVGVVKSFGVTAEQIEDTLKFICLIAEQDINSNQSSRLADTEFVRKHFDMIRWLPDKTQSHKYQKNKPLIANIPDDQILLTKYYIKLAQGSIRKTKAMPHALYSLPNDEIGLTLEQAQNKKASLVRYRYTKQDILKGILEQQGLATPLIWLSRVDLEDALMQGTVKVTIDGTETFFNVHRNNGIQYQRNINKEAQGRYWYFKQTKTVLGYGKDANLKIPIYPHVTVAGDLKHLGLGKLILLSHGDKHRLTILADTGGAFENNQYQLDYLGGFFKDWADYIASYKTFPDYFEARILVLKKSIIVD